MVSKKLCSDVMVILIEDEDPVVAECVTGVTAAAAAIEAAASTDDIMVFFIVFILQELSQ